MIEQGKKGNHKNNGSRAITRTPASDPGPKREDKERKRIQESYGNDIGIIFGEVRGI